MNIDIIQKRIKFEDEIERHSSTLKNIISTSNALVIGGAGTIGSNYIKQILRFKPKKIVVVDSNENALTELTRDLRSSNLLDYKPEYIPYPVNLLSDTFDKIFYSDNFQIIANFSAHKHVRSEKDLLSIEALIKNNVYGAIKLLNLCTLQKPKFFFSVSTDKATNPVNVMGASKKIMEQLIISKKDDFRVSTARFANVAFSNGSLLEGFISRINKKQPLACPSDIKRFFVTPEQSGQICLLATFLGESGNIFFPKLDHKNDQIYFKDLAIDFLNKNGLTPLIVSSEKKAKSIIIANESKEYPIYFFKTDTSGEKPFEEFYSIDEDYNLNDYQTLGFIKPNKLNVNFRNIQKEFDTVFNSKNSTKSSIIHVLKNFIPNFNHIETGNSLDSKM